MAQQGDSQPQEPQETQVERVTSLGKWLTATFANPSQRRRIVQAAAGILVVAALVLLLRGLLTPAVSGNAPAKATATPAPAAPLVGHYAPDVTIPDLHGNPMKLSSLRGSIVLLNFWYIACPPCQIEMPTLERTYLAHTAQGFTVVGVNTTDSAEAIAEYDKPLGYTYPMLRDDGGRAQLAYEVRAMPSSFLIDRSGVIRAVYTGPINSSDFQQQLAKLLTSK